MAEKKTQREELPLEMSGQLYRHLFESLNDAAFIADAETGLILQTNYAAVRLLGRSRDEIIGMHQSELHPPGEAERFRRQFARHAESGGIGEDEGAVIRKDGTVVPVVISAAPIEIGRRKLLLGLFRDVTERKRIEEALRRSEELFKTLAESAPIGIFLTDVQGNTRYINGKSRGICGLLEGEISGDRWQKAVHPDDIRRVIANQEKAARDGRPLEQEFRIVRPDGEIRRVHTRTVVLPGQQGAPGGILGMIEDVTDAKLAEEERLHSAKLEAVLELAVAACHELNQPLQVVSGFAQLIRDRLPQESPLRGDIGKMLDGVEKLAAITRKLNGITRYETKDYVKGWKIVDLDRAASGGEPTGGADKG